MRSIIGSPSRTFPGVHPLDAIADTRALERACYDDSLKSRPGTVGSTGGSITRGAPVIVPELGKPRQSPLTYEDHGAPFASHLPRGSPVTTREPTPRLQEGEWVPVGKRHLTGQEVLPTDRYPLPIRTPRDPQLAASVLALNRFLNISSYSSSFMLCTPPWLGEAAGSPPRVSPCLSRPSLLLHTPRARWHFSPWLWARLSPTGPGARSVPSAGMTPAQNRAHHAGHVCVL